MCVVYVYVCLYCVQLNRYITPTPKSRGIVLVER